MKTLNKLSGIPSADFGIKLPLLAAFVVASFAQPLQANECITASSADNSPVDGLTMCFTKPEPTALSTARHISKTTAAESATVSGAVYFDRNHDQLRQASEFGTGLALCAKLLDANHNVAASVPVSPIAGTYAFAAVEQGEYEIVVTNAPDGKPAACHDDFALALPMVQSGYVATEVAAMKQSISITNNTAVKQNFGLISGSRLAGRIYNYVPNAPEIVGMEQVQVSVTCDGEAVAFVNTNSEGDYLAFIPSSSCANGAMISVAANNPEAFITVGASTGNTAGLYDAAAKQVAFENTVGQSYQGINFSNFSAVDYLEDQRFAAVCEAEVSEELATYSALSRDYVALAGLK